MNTIKVELEFNRDNRSALCDFTDEFIKESLIKFNMNITKASLYAGISRPTLYRRIKESQVLSELFRDQRVKKYRTEATSGKRCQ